MGAEFHFHATVTNVAENITNNITNNYYASPAMAPLAKEQFLLPATDVYPEQEHVDSGTSAMAECTFGHGRGAKKKQMFKSQQETRRWAELFVQYLKSHHKGNMNVDTSGKNFVTRALLSFLREWQRYGIVDKNSVCGPACARFLQDGCNLTFEVEPKAYEDRLTRILNGKAKRPSTIDDVQDYVRQRCTINP